jgi:hypothetical protein
MRAIQMITAMFLAGCDAVVADETTFVTTYGSEFCDHASSCNPSLACSPEVGDRASCAYDPSAAAECLGGSWSCNTEFAGYEYAEPPAACQRVWDCSVAVR